MKRLMTAIVVLAVLAATAPSFAADAIDCRDKPCPSFTAKTRIELFDPNDAEFTNSVHRLIGRFVTLRRDEPNYLELRRQIVGLIATVANVGDPTIAQAMLNHDFGLTDDERARFKKIADRGAASDTRVIQVWKDAPAKK